MELTHIEKTFLSLLRAGIWEKPIDSSENFVLDENAWEQVLSLSRSQTVAALVAKGIDFMPENAPEPSESFFNSIAVDVDRCEANSEIISRSISDLMEYYSNASLHPVLLKGNSIARLYPNPTFRESGDIDLWFPSEEFEKAVPNNSTLSSDGSESFEIFDSLVELHPDILNISSPFKKKLIKEIINTYGFEHCDGYTTTSPMLTMLLLCSHILKHSIGRGIGLRQVCDFALAYQKLQFDRDSFALLCSKLGMGRWLEVLTELCRKYLAQDANYMQSADTETTELADKLMRKILDGGNFGQYDDRPSGSWHTFLSFFSNAGFALRVAGGESFWTVVSLMRGWIAKLFVCRSTITESQD